MGSIFLVVIIKFDESRGKGTKQLLFHFSLVSLKKPLKEGAGEGFKLEISCKNLNNFKDIIHKETTPIVNDLFEYF